MRAILLFVILTLSACSAQDKAAYFFCMDAWYQVKDEPQNQGVPHPCLASHPLYLPDWEESRGIPYCERPSVKRKNDPLCYPHVIPVN